MYRKSVNIGEPLFDGLSIRHLRNCGFVIFSIYRDQRCRIGLTNHDRVADALRRFLASDDQAGGTDGVLVLCGGVFHAIGAQGQADRLCCVVNVPDEVNAHSRIPPRTLSTCEGMKKVLTAGKFRFTRDGMADRA
jgi:hypothetical protein